LGIPDSGAAGRLGRKNSVTLRRRKVARPAGRADPDFVLNALLPLPGFPCTAQVVFAGRALHEIFHKDSIKEENDASSPSKGVDYSSAKPTLASLGTAYFFSLYAICTHKLPGWRKHSVRDPVLFLISLTANSRLSRAIAQSRPTWTTRMTTTRFSASRFTRRSQLSCHCLPHTPALCGTLRVGGLPTLLDATRPPCLRCLEPAGRSPGANSPSVTPFSSPLAAPPLQGDAGPDQKGLQAVRAQVPP
jgi:hypothetical protein